MAYIAYGLMVITSAAMGILLASLWYNACFEVFED